MNERKTSIRDPDYEITETAKEQKRIRDELEQTQVLQKVRGIIKTEFQKELDIREKQLELIQQRINKTAKSLHVLRYCLITSYYNKSETRINAVDDGSITIDGQSRIHPALKKLLGSNTGNVYRNLGLRKIKHREKLGKTESKNEVLAEDKIENVFIKEEIKEEPEENDDSLRNINVIRNRKLYKHQIVIGNISKWAPSQSPEDSSTHKWMLYVRGPKEYPDVSHIVEKVIFYLHPSYKPNDVIEIGKSPFHLSRRGWGEFPVRIQLFFHGKLNKPVDVIHNLKLDMTYTGRQTLGNETVVEVSLYDISKTDSQTLKNGIHDQKIVSSDQQNAESKIVAGTEYPEECQTLENRTIIENKNDSRLVERKETYRQNAETETSHNQPYNNVLNSVKFDHSYCRRNTHKSKENGHEEKPNSSSSNHLNNIDVEMTIGAQGDKIYIVKQKRKATQQSLLKSSIKRIKTEIIDDTSTPVLDVDRHKINFESYRLANLDQALTVLFKKMPLITEFAANDSFKEMYPFTALSMEEFTSWSSCRQYASEWTRARIIKKILRRSKFEKLPTKMILLYGRMHGYAPFTRYKIFKSIPKADFNYWRCASTQSNVVLKESDVPVNVTDCDIEKVRKDNIMVTWTDNFKSERSYVKQAALDIGVVLKQDQIVPGVLYNTTERLLYECMKCFAEDLLRQSVACASKENNITEDIVLNPTHIVQGLHYRPDYEKILLFNKDTLHY